MAQTESDIAIAVNQVLDNYEVTVDSASGSMTRLKIKADDRFEVRKDVEDSLKKAGIDYQSSEEVYKNKNWVSSFPGTIIKADGTKKQWTEFIYKPSKTKQSGGGAALTKLTESAQCVYAAVAAQKGGNITVEDITPQSVSQAARLFDIDETVQNVLHTLPADWVQSCVKGANEIYDEFGSGFKLSLIHI